MHSSDSKMHKIALLLHFASCLPAAAQPAAQQQHCSRKCRKEFLRNIARRILCITPSPAAAVPKRRLLLGLLPGQAAAAAARCKGTAVPPPPPAGALLGRGWRRRGASARCSTDVLLHFLLPRHHPAHPAHHPLCHTIRLSQNHLS